MKIIITLFIVIFSTYLFTSKLYGQVKVIEYTKKMFINDAKLEEGKPADEIRTVYSQRFHEDYPYTSRREFLKAGCDSSYIDPFAKKHLVRLGGLDVEKCIIKPITLYPTSRIIKMESVKLDKKKYGKKMRLYTLECAATKTSLLEGLQIDGGNIAATIECTQ